MKKFIKELEDRGIMKSIVRSAIITEKVTGIPVKEDGLELVLSNRFSKDESLEDIFIQEAYKIAMKSVFNYVQKQIEEKKLENADNVSDEKILESLNSVSKAFDDLLKSIVNDGK